jgi:hypothetical protein
VVALLDHRESTVTCEIYLWVVCRHADPRWMEGWVPMLHVTPMASLVIGHGGLVVVVCLCL